MKIVVKVADFATACSFYLNSERSRSLKWLWQILAIGSPKFTTKAQERPGTFLSSLVEGTTLLNTVMTCGWIESGKILNALLNSER